MFYLFFNENSIVLFRCENEVILPCNKIKFYFYFVDKIEFYEISYDTLSADFKII